MFRKWSKTAVFAGVLLAALVRTPVGLAVEADCAKAGKIFLGAPASGAAREEALLKALDLCPQHTMSLNDLGLIRENQGKLREAEDLYRKAIAANERFVPPYAGLGDVLKALGDPEGAAKAYREFLRRAGSVPRLQSYILEYHQRLKEVGEPPKPDVIGSAAIVRALTTPPSKQPHRRGLSVIGRQLDKPNIDITILFDFNSAEISPASHAQMDEVARALHSSELQATGILVEGHTDSIGSADYNMDLSRRRAASVKRALVERFGVSAEHLSTRGMGETAPVDTNESDPGRARNRRVTFINLGVNPGE